MTRLSRRGRSDVQANLTPMIDVTFLLIVFFVLVSQIVEVESEDLNLPRPEDPATERAGDDPRVVINVLPVAGSGDVLGYRLGTRRFAADSEGVRAMTTHLAGLLMKDPGLDVNLRADQRTHYRWIAPVFDAVRAAADRIPGRSITARVNLVVVREE